MGIGCRFCAYGAPPVIPTDLRKNACRFWYLIYSTLQTFWSRGIGGGFGRLSDVSGGAKAA